MKKPIRYLVFNALAIGLLAWLIPGISYGNNLSTLILVALVLSLLNFVIKPILKIIFLPINLITLGLAGWLIDVILLYLATILIPEFTISTFSSPAFSILGISIPSFVFSGFWAYLATAFMLSLITTFIYAIL